MASSSKENTNVAAAVKKEAQKDAYKTCVEWGKGQRAPKETRLHAARTAYLADFNFINGLDIGNAREKKVSIGMTACGVFAALGRPEDVNTTETRYSTSYQIIYRERGIYLYGDLGPNGITIRSIQR